MKLKLISLVVILNLLQCQVALSHFPKKWKVEPVHRPIKHPEQPTGSQYIKITDLQLKPVSPEIERLRELMTINTYYNRRIEAYVVPSADAHQSEYISECDQRRAFISNFTGSAGTAVITHDQALLWTDGRYWTQASLQLSHEWTLMKSGAPGVPSVVAWLADNLPVNSVVAADPTLLSMAEWWGYQRGLYSKNHWMYPLDDNLVDEVWGLARPERVLNPVVPQPFLYTGRSAGNKLNECFNEMKRYQADVLVISALDEVAYLLNWRGSDVAYNPVFYAYVILVNDRVHIFIDKDRVEQAALAQLAQEKIVPRIHPYEEVRTFLQELCESGVVRNAWIPSSSSYAFYEDCQNKTGKTDISPVALMKAVKNPSEIRAMRQAHTRDSVALVKFFSWLEDTVVNNSSRVSEKSADDMLLKFRQ